MYFAQSLRKSLQKMEESHTTTKSMKFQGQLDQIQSHLITSICGSATRFANYNEYQ